MFDDLISCSWRCATAGTRSQPGRAATASGRNFLPHHEPRMMSGARRTTSSGSAMMRSLPSECWALSAKQSSPPAMPISSETQRMPEIIGSSHSSKYTRAHRIELLLQPHGQRGRFRLAADHAAEHADHLQDAGHVALIEDEDVEPEP